MFFLQDDRCQLVCPVGHLSNSVHWVVSEFALREHCRSSVATPGVRFGDVNVFSLCVLGWDDAGTSSLSKASFLPKRDPCRRTVRFVCRLVSLFLLSSVLGSFSFSCVPHIICTIHFIHMLARRMRRCLFAGLLPSARCSTPFAKSFERLFGFSLFLGLSVVGRCLFADSFASGVALSSFFSRSHASNRHDASQLSRDENSSTTQETRRHWSF